MGDYHEHADFDRLADLQKLAPADFAAFVQMDRVVGRTGGAIPVKYRELPGLAVAFTTQCPYCLDVHTANAKKAGATREEVAETVFIAAALRAGAAVTHGTLALKLFENAP